MAFVPRATFEAHRSALQPLRAQGRLVVMSEGAGDSPDVLAHLKVSRVRVRVELRVRAKNRMSARVR